MDHTDILLQLVLFTHVIYTSQVGTCWLSMNRRGLCRHVYSLNSTRENCCSSGLASISWSPYQERSRGLIFFWSVLSGGYPECSPCHSSCSNVTCGPNKECRMRHGRPKCVCAPACPQEIKRSGLVCGSNGLTYRSECSLLRYNCRFSSIIRVAYNGRCKRSCNNVECHGGLSCLEDQNGIPHCVRCPAECSNETMPSQVICGEDGVTYASNCHLFKAICRKQSSIRVAYRNACIENITCSTLRCPENYTCLTDVRTGFPQCAACRNLCPSGLHGSTVCGTDGETYSNYCTMQEEACQKRKVIKTRHSGSCNEIWGNKSIWRSKKCRKHRRHKNMIRISLPCISREFRKVRRHRIHITRRLHRNGN